MLKVRRVPDKRIIWWKKGGLRGENESFAQRMTIALGKTPREEEGNMLTSRNRFSKLEKISLNILKLLYIGERYQQTRSAKVGGYKIYD